MKIVIFVVLAVLIVLVGAVAMFPMSMAAEFAARQVPDFRYAKASGSVWDGKLTSVAYGSQRIGDLAVKADFGALFGGKAAGTLGLAREGLSGAAGIAWPFGGKEIDLDNFKLGGSIATVPGMPKTITAGGGKFTLEFSDLSFAGDSCKSARGEVWTDALAKVNRKGWVGPELRGPITCEAGKLVAEAFGKSPSGEDVTARMDIGAHLDMAMTASVLNAQGSAVEALTSLGFVQEGNALVIRQAIGS